VLILALTQAKATNNTLEATNNSLEDRVTALEDEVALHLEELLVHEEHILALEWHDENRVIKVVTDKVWDRMSTCYNDDCYYGDPVLYAFYSTPSHNRHSYILDLLVNGSWYAERASDTLWLVTVPDKDGYYYTFVADSTHRIICWDQSIGCSDQLRTQQ
jgi:hypothetical protein